MRVPVHLPGHELVSEGLADLAAGRESETSLLVSMAAPQARTAHSPIVGSSARKYAKDTYFSVLLVASEQYALVAYAQPELWAACQLAHPRSLVWALDEAVYCVEDA